MTIQQLKDLLISKGVKEEDIKIKEDFFIYQTLVVNLYGNLDIFIEFLDLSNVNLYNYVSNSLVISINDNENFDRLLHFYKAFKG